MTSASPPIRSVESVEDDVAAAAAMAGIRLFAADGFGFCFFGVGLGRVVCFLADEGF
jgi:hypothetical protein